MYGYVQAMANENKDIRGVRLYVDHTNLHAQNVYKKLGMNDDHYKLFEWMKSQKPHLSC